MATKMSNVKNIREDLYIGPKIPQGLTAAIEGLTKEILRHRPEDIYDFAANHFEKLLELRKQYEESEVNNVQESNRQKEMKEVEKMCNCKKKQQSVDEATLMQSSGWSLNETAKVLKRHRSIFGDTGKKISLDEIYDLANAKSTENLSPTKSKHRKSDKKEERSDSPKRPSDDSCEEKKARSDRSKRSSNQKKKMTSEESFESSTKIKEINYCSEIRKMSIEESQSSSYIHKVYEICETKSVMKEKVQESKHFNGKSPKTAPSGSKEPNSFSSGMSNKLSKSATCLSKSDGSQKSDGFESKLKETQTLLEQISTNLNETMRRSISAKDLRRVSQSSDYSEPKSTESSSASKLRQISLPTVRPFSATRSDFLKKLSSNGIDDALTLPIISQKPNKSPKQFDSGLTLPKLSPSNTTVPRAEGQPENFTIIRDIDKKVIDISENKIEFQQSVSISEKIELKSSPSLSSKDESLDDKGRETEKPDVTGLVSSRKSTEDGKQVRKSTSFKSTRSGTKVEEPKSTRSEVSSKSSTKSRTKREESQEKESFGKRRSESARSILSKDKNKEMSGKAKVTKTKSVDSSGFKIDSQNVKTEKDLTEKMKTKSADQVHRCPVHDCNKGLNNDLLKSKLEELVKAEQLILRDSEPDKKVKETDKTEKSAQEKKKVAEIDTAQGKSSREKLPSGKSSSKSESEKQTIRSFREEKQHSNDKAVKIEQIEDNVFAYILTEGSPCEIPDSVTTVIFPDSPERNSTEVEMTIEEIDNQVLTSVFGEQIDYEEMIYEPLLSADFKALKNVHDISLLRQDLHRIKEEEEDEENDVSANEDSTIVLDRILETQQVDEAKKGKDDKESDMSLQEFLLHCTLNESTEETSINDNTDDAVTSFVPELNLKIIEDATESTSKTSHQKSAGGGSVDEIENSVLQSERTLTSNNELEGSTHESLTGDQQPTTRDETSLQLDTNLTDSPKSSASALSQNEKLIRAVTIIQRAFKRYKIKKQARRELEQQLINNEKIKIEQPKSSGGSQKVKTSSYKEKSSLGDEAKEIAAKLLLIDEIADAVVKIQKFYRNYKSRTDSDSVLLHEQKVKSANEMSSEKSVKQEKKVNSANEVSSEKTIREEEKIKSESMISSEKSISEEERVKSASEVLSEKTIKQENVESEGIKEEPMKRDEPKVIKEQSYSAMNKMVHAALTIQRYYRKYKIRKNSKTAVNEDTTNSSIVKKVEKTLSVRSLSKENSITIDTNKVSSEETKSASAKLQNTETLISKGTTETESKEDQISTANSAAKTKKMSSEELTKIKSKDEKIKSATIDEMVVAAIKIQKMYRRYKSTKNKTLSCASAKNVPSPPSFQLEHTGEFHDCIALSVLDFLPKLNRNIKSENRSKSEGTSGDHRRTRREWNQNRPVSPSFLYPSGFGRSMSEGNAGEAANDTPRSSRFPGMMIYADSLKNTYRPRTVQQPVESENFMNFVVFSGEEPVINFMTMKSAQSREVEKEAGFTEPQDTGVIIEEINNDDDLSQSKEQ